MTCSHCNFTFAETEILKDNNNLYYCPNCKCRIGKDIGDEEEFVESTKNPTAQILRYIAYITWAAGMVFTIAALFIYPEVVTFLTFCCYLYAIFVSGMFTYAFAEVIQLLTDIRDS